MHLELAISRLNIPAFACAGLFASPPEPMTARERELLAQWQRASTALSRGIELFHARHPDRYATIVLDLSTGAGCLPHARSDECTLLQARAAGQGCEGKNSNYH